MIICEDELIQAFISELDGEPSLLKKIICSINAEAANTPTKERDNKL